MSQMSYVHKTATSEHRTLFQLLDVHAAEHPKKEAVVMRNLEGGRSCITFSQYKEQSIAMAIGLLRLGFKRGDRVALLLTNGIDFVISQMALCRIGVNIIVPALKLDHSSRLKALIIDLRCVGIICKLSCDTIEDTRIADVIHDLLGSDSNSISQLKIVITTNSIIERRFSEDHMYSYDHVISMGENDEQGRTHLQEIQGEIHFNDRAIVFFTSGSTGKPKAIQYTHHSFVNSSLMSGRTLRITNQARVFNDKPMDWITGLAYGLAPVPLFGATLISIPPEISFNGGHISFVLKVLQEEECTNAMLFPYLLNDILLSREPYTYLRKLQFCSFGGESVPNKLFKDVLNILPQLTILYGYGSSEDGIVAHATINKKNVDQEDCNFMAVSPGVEMMVIDHTGKLLPVGSTGDIYVRGPNVFLEYLEDEEKTAQEKGATGWFCTSDSGILDARGRLRVFGRRSEIIKRAGITVFPDDIEQNMLKHPWVAQAQVVGVPDQRVSEETCACIVLKKDFQDNQKKAKAELEQWCLHEFGTQFNIPMYQVGYFIFMENYPSTRTGKVDRKSLKKIATRRLGLQ